MVVFNRHNWNPALDISDEMECGVGEAPNSSRRRCRKTPNPKRRKRARAPYLARTRSGVAQAPLLVSTLRSGQSFIQTNNDQLDATTRAVMLELTSQMLRNMYTYFQ